ncbi:MAG: CehA/McbA family metallohydrolase [Spirochaetota bacterium]
MHTSDVRPLEWNEDGFLSPMRGYGRLNEHAANYEVRYDDGTVEVAALRRRHQVGAFRRPWGENCFECVSATKPRAIRAHHEQVYPEYGISQTRVSSADSGTWVNWLYAWENPHPEKQVVALAITPVSGTMILFGASYGNLSDHPLRWRVRRKAILTLPEGTVFRPALDGMGLFVQVQLDLGQVISAGLKTDYPGKAVAINAWETPRAESDRGVQRDFESAGRLWDESYNNQLPGISRNQVLIEYTSHPEACFHLWDGRVVPVAEVERDVRAGETGPGGDSAGRYDARRTALPLEPVAPAERRVVLRVVEKGSKKPVPVKLHVHGEAGEYLAPVDRHRLPNAAWFEDYSVDFAHRNLHYCTYICGETVINVPLGCIYIEISKGFEIKPVRKTYTIDNHTAEVVIELERVLDWREKGWVSADTHVHFLSPVSALLEGSAEGVNVVNLLASQWGELMTNVGDFDGKTTWGSRETGGDGEYLVRVGTENRQHILGHISLLGYKGKIIAPMTTGGPEESALGDPVEILLTEWARQCRQQGGVVVLPHFPDPRAEHAASVVCGDVDALEMTSWGDLYNGINPYSLSDWYRYLNCGYLVAAVGGTDKMSADTAVGTVRTYARAGRELEFTYEAWMDAVRRAETFVTYGPLLEFSVEGKPMGSRISLGPKGGTLEVSWEVASVTIPLSRVECIVNGEIRASKVVDRWQDSGSWSVKVDRSSWIALLVRGHYPDKPEIVTAHSSPVMIEVAGTPFGAAADTLTILEQIEGALAYLEVLATRVETKRYREMRLILESAHRKIHNGMHNRGWFHDHTPVMDHPEHR